MPSYRLILLSSAVMLSGCAYSVESQLQDVTVLTPGALHAKCIVNVDGFRYKYRPPETINIKKSDSDMIVDCIAPGNRERQIVIAPRKSELDSYNIASGYVIGAAVDHLSGARYQYPDVIYVDFTDIPYQPEYLPAHNSIDVKQPEEYDLEEFLPGQPRLNSDRYAVPVPLQKRSRPSQLFSDTSAFQQMMENPAPQAQGTLGPSDMREQQDLIDLSDPAGESDATPITQSPPPELSIDPALMNPASVEPPPEAVASPPAPEAASEPAQAAPPSAAPEPTPATTPAAEPPPVQGPPAPPAATPAEGTQPSSEPAPAEPMPAPEPSEPAPFPPPEFLQKKQQNQ